MTELRVGPNRLQIKINPEEAGAGLFAFESTFPPGGMMPYLHFHRDQEEAFYVLEGLIEYTRGEDRIVAPTGTMVHIPIGLPHRFRNLSQNAPARHLALVTPGLAGLRMMQDFGEIDFTDLDAVVETMHRHNSELVQTEQR
jgi:quercetin dioxygenase-like cupin family protein